MANSVRPALHNLDRMVWEGFETVRVVLSKLEPSSRDEVIWCMIRHLLLIAQFVPPGARQIDRQAPDSLDKWTNL